ncbi:hypothetical protein EV702DRAFT_1094800 [Suillus placidus]|uniref:Uncharacterized protein n=1 Tax=Suillus placidus TaxID=48579 RepID=A0A9P6ZYL9_9AGAM|nr:hypothetical protein EV702DRAFT_1094800 [Suillus placidus]
MPLGAQIISMTSHSYLSMAETSCPSHLQVVTRGDRELKFKAGLLSLAEELQFYILSFLPCQDILRCTSYIVELSGQQLLAVPDTDNYTPISKRLQLLRDKAHTWFKFNSHSFETVSIPKELCYANKIVTRGHLCLWDQDLAAIIPTLPKSPQNTVERWQRTLSSVISVPHSDKLDVFMDPAQNLIVVAYVVDETLHIDLRALDGDGVHPQAAGSRLFLSGLEEYGEHHVDTESANFKGLGRHIALRRISLSFDMWQLQIWDWQHSTTSNCFLSGDLDPIDFCFLGNNRTLVVRDALKLYSIEDMSLMPQLLACFLMPIPLLPTQCFLPTELQMQAQQTYISNPEHQLLCMTTFLDETFSENESFVSIISTRIFFDLDGMAVAMPIPWNRWGPSNTRIFKHNWEWKVHLSGNRVLQAFPVGTSDLGPIHYKLHIMDFSPLAVTNRRGLGRVVKEPSTIDIGDFTDSSQETQSLTTSLPYVEVVSDREFKVEELEDIWIDKDRIYLLLVNRESNHPLELSRKLGVFVV